MPGLGGTMSVRYIDIGIPVTPGGDTRVVGLAYCPPAETLVLTVAVLSNSARRFFIRGQHEVCYRELNPPGPDLTRSASVYAVSLPDGRLTPLPKPTGYPAERTWISQLLASSSDATWLHVVAAETSPPRDDGGYSVIYSLARMNVKTGQLDKIVDLPTPFA